MLGINSVFASAISARKGVSPITDHRASSGDRKDVASLSHRVWSGGEGQAPSLDGRVQSVSSSNSRSIWSRILRVICRIFGRSGEFSYFKEKLQQPVKVNFSDLKARLEECFLEDDEAGKTALIIDTVKQDIGRIAMYLPDQSNTVENLESLRAQLSKIVEHTQVQVPDILLCMQQGVFRYINNDVLYELLSAEHKEKYVVQGVSNMRCELQKNANGAISITVKQRYQVSSMPSSFSTSKTLDVTVGATIDAEMTINFTTGTVVLNLKPIA